MKPDVADAMLCELAARGDAGTLLYLDRLLQDTPRRQKLLLMSSEIIARGGEERLRGLAESVAIGLRDATTIKEFVAAMDGKDTPARAAGALFRWLAQQARRRTGAR